MIDYSYTGKIDDNYIGELDSQDIRWFDYLINSKGGEVVALNALLHDLDCTRIYDDGSRPVQTINYGYKRDIAGFIYINNRIKDIAHKIYLEYNYKLVNRHEDNLNFEKNNPPIYYRTKQRTSGRSNRRTAEIADIFTGEKSTVDVGSGKTIKPKENAATRKAKALNDKSINFAFNNFKVNK